VCWGTARPHHLKHSLSVTVRAPSGKPVWKKRFPSAPSQRPDCAASAAPLSRSSPASSLRHPHPPLPEQLPPRCRLIARLAIQKCRATQARYHASECGCCANKVTLDTDLQVCKQHSCHSPARRHCTLACDTGLFKQIPQTLKLQPGLAS
jgi:hypothetical protein